VVFTDLDGTLLDHETYTFRPAQEALEELRRRGIPLVVCSSKTRAEIEPIQRDLRIAHPFICENGGAVFIPKGYLPRIPKGSIARGAYDVLEIGAGYGQLTDILHRVCGEQGIQVVGFNDMTPEEVAEECGLSLAEARRAKAREYDEAFRILTPGREARTRLIRALQTAGLRCTRGGRYYHVTGRYHKGGAVRKLKGLYRQVWGSVPTIGLGDSPNDLPLLRAVDIPVVVRNPVAEAAERLARKIPSARVSVAFGPRGWNEVILDLIGRRLTPRAAV
jgi:mannosyl-3-phosphoglycerate phosphatase